MNAVLFFAALQFLFGLALIGRLVSVRKPLYLRAIIVMAVGFCIVSSYIIARPEMIAAVYDAHTPIAVVHDYKPDAVEVRRDEPFEIVWKYDKRPGCTGQINYVWKSREDGSKQFVTRPVGDSWAAGTNLTARTTVRAPKELSPGQYWLRWDFVGQCGHADGYRATPPGFVLRGRSPDVLVTLTD